MGVFVQNGPIEGTTYAAYRPILLTVVDEPTPNNSSLYPVVMYCDVHINGTYYKSISSTAWAPHYKTILVGPVSNPIPITLLAGRSFTFDVSGMVQEWLRSESPDFTNLLPAKAVVPDPGRASCVIRMGFRSGRRDSTTGLVVVGGTPPVQATNDTPAFNGSPEAWSNYLVTVNAAVQHEARASFRDYLRDLKLAVPSTQVFLVPLTQRQDHQYFLARNTLDHFPFMIEWRGLDGSNDPIAGFYIGINYRHKDYPGTVFYDETDNSGVFTFELTGHANVWYLLSGIPQLRTLSWINMAPEDWDYGITEYQLMIIAPPISPGTTPEVCLLTPWVVVKEKCADGQALRFLNTLGGYDVALFTERYETDKVTSARWQQSINTIPGSGEKRMRGLNRFNPRSNETVQVISALYSERAQVWFKELLDSPEVFEQVSGAQLGGNQEDDLLPVVVLDGEWSTVKQAERYTYVQTVVYDMANPNIRQRR